MRYAAKMTSKGQVTVPKPVREKLELLTGDYLVFEVKNGRIVLTKSPLHPTEDFAAFAEQIAERFKEQGITRADVDEAIRWARGQTRNKKS